MKISLWDDYAPESRSRRRVKDTTRYTSNGYRGIYRTDTAVASLGHGSYDSVHKNRCRWPVLSPFQSPLGSSEKSRAGGAVFNGLCARSDGRTNARAFVTETFYLLSDTTDSTVGGHGAAAAGNHAGVMRDGGRETITGGGPSKKDNTKPDRGLVNYCYLDYGDGEAFFFLPRNRPGLFVLQPGWK